MDTPADDLLVDDRELLVSHVIPSVELKGSPTQKLRTLDRLIRYLQRLRLALAGEQASHLRGHEQPGRYIDTPAWPWFAGGAAFGAAFVVLLIVARSCA